MMIRRSGNVNYVHIRTLNDIIITTMGFVNAMERREFFRLGGTPCRDGGGDCSVGDGYGFGVVGGYAAGG